MKTFWKIGLLSVSWLSEIWNIWAVSPHTEDIQSLSQEIKKHGEKLKSLREEIERAGTDIPDSSSPLTSLMTSQLAETIERAIKSVSLSDSASDKSEITKAPPSTGGLVAPATETKETLTAEEQTQVETMADDVWNSLGATPVEQAVRITLLQRVRDEADSRRVSYDDPSIDRIFSALVGTLQTRYPTISFGDCSSFETALKTWNADSGIPTTMSLAEETTIPVRKTLLRTTAMPTVTLAPEPMVMTLEATADTEETPPSALPSTSIPQKVSVQSDGLIETPTPSLVASAEPIVSQDGWDATPSVSAFQRDDRGSIVLPETPCTDPSTSSRSVQPMEISQDSELDYLSYDASETRYIVVGNDAFESLEDGEVKPDERDQMEPQQPTEQTVADSKLPKIRMDKTLIESRATRPIAEPDLPKKRKQSRDDEEVREPAGQVALVQSADAAEGATDRAPEGTTEQAPEAEPSEPAVTSKTSEQTKSSKDDKKDTAPSRPIPTRILNLFPKAPQQPLKPRHQNISVIEIESEEEITRSNIRTPNEEQIELRFTQKPEADQALKAAPPLTAPKANFLKVIEEQIVREEDALTTEIVPLPDWPSDPSDEALVPLEEVPFPGLQDFQNATLRQPDSATVQSVQPDKVLATRILVFQNDTKAPAAQALNAAAEFQAPDEQANISPDADPTPWSSGASLTSYYPTLTPTGTSFFTKAPEPVSEFTPSHSSIIFHG